MCPVTKLNVAGIVLWYSTYLGASGGEAGGEIAVDGVGDVTLMATTGSTDLLSHRTSPGRSWRTCAPAMSRTSHTPTYSPPTSAQCCANTACSWTISATAHARCRTGGRWRSAPPTRPA